jgi:uncharacterized membrane protein
MLAAGVASDGCWRWAKQVLRYVEMPSHQLSWDWTMRRPRIGLLYGTRSGACHHEAHLGRAGTPRWLTLSGGVLLGAGLMYVLDPSRGRRRRALLRDKLIHTAHKTGHGIDATARDLANRARGLLAEARLRMRDGDVPDEVLKARVRAGLGGAVSHPRAIEVTASNGRVRLGGPVLAHEVAGLLARVAAVPGVAEVEDRLEVHEQAGDVPGLQGGPARAGGQFELRPACWAPAPQFVASLGGAGLVLYGASRRGVFGTALGAVGLGLLARGIANLPLRRLAGVGAGRRAVSFQKTITVDAPVERVFEFWSRYENFPRFMSHVREVRQAASGQSHWIVAGPAGAPIEWDAVVTKYETNRALAWKTVPNSVVAHAGVARFEPTADGGTRLDIKLSYNPPAGAMGHVVATLFGVDPQRTMDDDLVRLKSLLEAGKATAHGEEVTLAEVIEAVREQPAAPIRRVG